MTDIEQMADTADEAWDWSPVRFALAQPFPHAVIDGWWPAQLLLDVLAEFPPVDSPQWTAYDNARESKQEGGGWAWGEVTEMLMRVLADGPFVTRIEKLLGYPPGNLHAESVGGGMHQIPPGGRLDVHADFNASPWTGGRRVANVLIYLNEQWDPAWGGSLELWDADRPVRKIVPVFNRMVIFETSDRSWHGHPTPTAPPDGRCRRSIACYYFTNEPVVDEHSTLWHPGAR